MINFSRIEKNAALKIFGFSGNFALFILNIYNCLIMELFFDAHTRLLRLSLNRKFSNISFHFHVFKLLFFLIFCNGQRKLTFTNFFLTFSIFADIFFIKILPLSEPVAILIFDNIYLINSFLGLTLVSDRFRVGI